MHRCMCNTLERLESRWDSGWMSDLDEHCAPYQGCQHRHCHCSACSLSSWVWKLLPEPELGQWGWTNQRIVPVSPSNFVQPSSRPHLNFSLPWQCIHPCLHQHTHPSCLHQHFQSNQRSRCVDRLELVRGVTMESVEI